MRTTVVLASYNGAARIIRQLESIRLQTRSADSVLILDDQSTDATREEVAEYIRRHHLEQWRLVLNPSRLGWKENFFRGLERVEEGLIFLCDQDDEWLPNKIEKMAGAMEENPKIEVLACDYEIVYEPGSVRARKYRKRRREKDGLVRPYLFKSSFFMNPSPGCTYAVRSSFVKQIEGYWFSEAPHDEFIWLMALLVEGAHFYNEPLMRLHRHGSNNSDIRYKDVWAQQENLRYIERMLEQMERFSNGNDLVTPEKRTALRKAREWVRRRQRLMENKNPLYWLMMAPWWRYYNSFRNCLSDLYLIIFGSFCRRT